MGNLLQLLKRIHEYFHFDIAKGFNSHENIWNRNFKISASKRLLDFCVPHKLMKTDWSITRINHNSFVHKNMPILKRNVLSLLLNWHMICSKVFECITKYSSGSRVVHLTILQKGKHVKWFEPNIRTKSRKQIGCYQYYLLRNDKVLSLINCSPWIPKNHVRHK